MSLGTAILQRRERLAQAITDLEDRYWNNEPIETLVAALTQRLTVLLQTCGSNTSQTATAVHCLLSGAMDVRSYTLAQTSTFLYSRKSRIRIARLLRLFFATYLISMSRSDTAFETSKPVFENAGLISPSPLRCSKDVFCAAIKLLLLRWRKPSLIQGYGPLKIFLSPSVTNSSLAIVITIMSTTS